MTKFGSCKLCMYLTAIGLTASFAVLIASNHLNLEFAKAPALLATALFAVWGLLHLIGYAKNGGKVKEECKACNSKLFPITRRSFMGITA